jgi:hypothetical protein
VSELKSCGKFIPVSEHERVRQTPSDRMKNLAPRIISALFVIWVVAKMMPPKPAPGFDVSGFGRLPVPVDGRVIPMDSLARMSLSIIRGRQTVETADGKKAPAIQWLMETLMSPERADNLRIFPVTNPDILGLFGWLDRKDKYFTFNELAASLRCNSEAVRVSRAN